MSEKQPPANSHKYGDLGLQGGWDRRRVYLKQSDTYRENYDSIFRKTKKKNKTGNR